MAFNDRTPIEEFNLASSDSRPPFLQNAIKGSPSSSTISTENAFDLSYSSVTFAPLRDAPQIYTVVCSQPIVEMPASKAQVSALALGDDDSQIIKLKSGKAFPFFGSSYDVVFVGSNGFVTFDRPDATFYAHRWMHFRFPRVSALFLDLDPTSGGSVGYAQMDDRLLVTFVDVPAFEAFPQLDSPRQLYTFQVRR